MFFDLFSVRIRLKFYHYDIWATLENNINISVIRIQCKTSFSYILTLLKRNYYNFV